MRIALMRGQGIYRGWWVVSAVFLGAMLTVGTGQYAFGLFVSPLEDTFGWSRTQINASLSFTAVSSLLAPLIGKIMDRHGARPVMAVSITLIGISYALRPWMSELWHWYGLSLLQYSGYMGASLLPAGRLVGIWFRETRGRVMGVAAMGNNFGGLVVPNVTGVLLTLVSWQGSYIAFAIFAAFVLIFAMVAVKEFPTSKDIREQDSNERGDAPPVLTGWTVTEALRSKAFYAITAAILMGTFTYSTILPQVPAHLTNEGVSLTAAALALSVLAGCGVVGKLTMGYLAERITARYALMIDLTGQASFLALMLFAGASPLVMWLSVAVFGFFMGAFGALFQLIVQEAFGIRNYGSILGIINVTTIISFGSGPILAGLSFDITGSYHIAFMTVAAFFLVGVVMLTQAGIKSAASAAGQPSAAD